MLTKTDTVSRPPHQVWMLYMLECPLHTGIYHIFIVNSYEFIPLRYYLTLQHMDFLK